MQLLVYFKFFALIDMTKSLEGIVPLVPVEQGKLNFFALFLT
jgi:hypothetical protein